MSWHPLVISIKKCYPFCFCFFDSEISGGIIARSWFFPVVEANSRATELGNFFKTVISRCIVYDDKLKVLKSLRQDGIYRTCNMWPFIVKRNHDREEWFLLCQAKNSCLASSFGQICLHHD
ncbi:MAG: hypothetical protein ABC360_07580 [Acetomicrobium sp.]